MNFFHRPYSFYQISKGTKTDDSFPVLKPKLWISICTKIKGENGVSHHRSCGIDFELRWIIKCDCGGSSMTSDANRAEQSKAKQKKRSIESCQRNKIEIATRQLRQNPNMDVQTNIANILWRIYMWTHIATCQIGMLYWFSYFFHSTFHFISLARQFGHATKPNQKNKKKENWVRSQKE